MRNSLNWRFLKGLYKLYKEGSVRLKLMDNAYIKNVLCQRKRFLDYKHDNKDIIEAKKGYETFFEKELLPQYHYYERFFNESGLIASGLKQYDNYDLQTLMLIFNNREEFSKNLTTARIFSSNVFKQKDSKYLESRPGLMKDVLFLLGIEHFPACSAKENQWRCVVDCPNPQYILICENLDFLKAWWDFYTNNIELWYAGGNNIPVIERIPERYLNLPMFYVGDLDYHGLKIFCQLKGIFRKLNIELSLITPSPDKAIFKEIKSGHHYSTWKLERFSGLDYSCFSSNEVELIEGLIKNNKWIEEQTLSPITEILSR
jgi:hypothetical protein